jgi:betaine-homocysteine S-methyltransferase
MFAPYCPDETVDGVPIPEACRRLEDAGAAVVGLNCARGPKTMIPLLKDIRKACKVGE